VSSLLLFLCVVAAYRWWFAVVTPCTYVIQHVVVVAMSNLPSHLVVNQQLPYDPLITKDYLLHGLQGRVDLQEGQRLPSLVRKRLQLHEQHRNRSAKNGFREVFRPKTFRSSDVGGCCVYYNSTVTVLQERFQGQVFSPKRQMCVRCVCVL